MTDDVDPKAEPMTKSLDREGGVADEGPAMTHGDFSIGLEFYTHTGKWRCTDVGTRVIVAIKLDAPEESWYAGPPYGVAEIVFDEDDMEACALSVDEL